MEPEARTRETERRLATVLFADLSGFTSLVEGQGDEAAYATVTSCLKLLDQIARRHGATVDKYMGDCIMAVFGVPRAVENGPLAAVNAAIEMRDRVAAFKEQARLDAPLDVHTGINTGSLISGDISGSAQREFAVVGDTVNIAARLKDLAPPGEIWVGSETHRRTQALFDYERIDSLELKGKRKRVDAFCLRSSTQELYEPRVGAQRTVSSALVGREAELLALRNAIASTRGGEGRIVNIVGEVGIGKSRMLAEARASQEASQVTWLDGRCLSMGLNMSHHPFRDLFRARYDFGPANDREDTLLQLERDLTRWTGEESSEITPFIATLMGVQLPESNPIHDMQPDAVERRMRAIMVQVLTRLAARGPVVIAIDDLHWADLSSIDLLEALIPLAEKYPICFVLLFRPHHDATSERVRNLVRASHSDRTLEIELEPLGERFARQLIDNLLAGGDVPHATRRAIRERGAGNPFFAEEVVRSLIDNGALSARDGSLFATERLDEVVIPGTIQEVLMARLDALPLGHRQLLQLASVVGSTFHLVVLADIASKDDLEETLEELESKGLITECDTSGTCSFKHPLIRETAYETILKTSREEIHRRVGESMEANLTENVSGLNAMLAYHFSRGRDLERGERYLFKAGEEAARCAASNEALYFFRAASRLYLERHGDAGDAGQKAALEKQVALAHFNRGQLAEAVEHFDRALGHLGSKVSRSKPMLYSRFMVDLAAACIWFLGPKNARRRPAASPAQCEVIAIRYKRALAQTTTASEFVFDTLALLHMLSRVDPKTIPDSGGIYAGAIGIFSWGGVSFKLGRRVLDEATRLVESGNVKELLLYYHLMEFIHDFLEGNWPTDEGFAEELVEEGIRVGRLWEVSTALDMSVQWRIQRGDWAAAEHRLAQLMAVAEDYGHDLALSARQCQGAMLDMERGAFERAWDEIATYLELHEELSFQLVGLATRARIELLMEDLDAAEASLDRAHRIRKKAGIMTPFHQSFYATSRYAVDLARLADANGGAGRRDLERRARSSRRRALGIAAKVAPRRTEIQRLAGDHAWLLGKHLKALEWYQKSLATGAHLGARPEQARTNGRVATRLREGVPGITSLGGRDAHAYWADASELFRDLGLEYELKKLEASRA